MVKILRKVDYPTDLDVLDFCSNELCEELKEPCQILRDKNNTRFGLKSKGNQSDLKDTDVEMSNVEVSLNNNCESSSSNATRDMDFEMDKFSWKKLDIEIA